MLKLEDVRGATPEYYQAYYPFMTRPELVREETGCAPDQDDAFFQQYYDLGSLKSCAANAKDVLALFSCVQQYNTVTKFTTCQSSTSAFKIAFCSSPLAEQKQNFTLYKAFVNGPDYNAHRFILLQNKAGYFVLDPLWCAPGMKLEDCIRTHTLSFFTSSDAVNARNIVQKLQKFSS